VPSAGLHLLCLVSMQHGFLHYKCFGGTGGKKVSCIKGQIRRGPEMAPFTATDTSLRRSLEVSRLSSYFALVCCSQNGVQ
jgi:hypothetical protein